MSIKSKEKRLNSIIKELYGIHEDLFGTSYSSTLGINEHSEFNNIIEAFRAAIFSIRQQQEERDQKEAKTKNKQSPELLRLNLQIR